MKNQRDQMMAFLNGLLKPEIYRDSCPNGLQVYGREDVSRVVTCTSVSEDFFSSASQIGADLLLVHHGLFWDGTSRVVDPWLARRLRILLENEMNLVAYHLPLDAHPKLGNNACLASLLDLQDRDFSFGHYKGTPIGCVGTLPQPLSLAEVAERFTAWLGSTPMLIGAGSDQVFKVGVVSGGAGDIPFLLEASQVGCDTYITGALFEQSVAIARESNLKVVALGHYNSEKLGVRKVGDHLGEHFGVEVVHLDVPNPI